jgi:signal transduction histidine kinase
VNEMPQLQSAEWWKRHNQALLTAAPLLVMLISRYPSRQIAWQWELLLAALAWVPLIARNRWPGPVLAVVAVVEAVSIGIAGLLHPPGSVLPASSMVALYTVSDRWPARRAWLAAAAVGISQFLVAVGTYPYLPRDLLYLNWAVVAVAAGQLVQERRTRLAVANQRAHAAEQSKEAEAQRRVIAERMRIAHDLHDVLAHHIAVVIAQAGVAEYLLETDPAASKQALSGITTNSRAALDELRVTLGLLRGEADIEEQAGYVPAPSVEHLDGLFAEFMQAGMPLSVVVRGFRGRLSAAGELALIRIIQEALTNASKHAPGSPVALELDWLSNPIRLCVTNDRPTSKGPLTNAGTGHGLIGMRERAAVAEGTLNAGPTPEGGYRVSATIPKSDASVDSKTFVNEVSENNETQGEAPAQ